MFIVCFKYLKTEMSSAANISYLVNDWVTEQFSPCVVDILFDFFF